MAPLRTLHRGIPLDLSSRKYVRAFFHSRGLARFVINTQFSSILFRFSKQKNKVNPPL